MPPTFVREVNRITPNFPARTKPYRDCLKPILLGRAGAGGRRIGSESYGGHVRPDDF